MYLYMLRDVLFAFINFHIFRSHSVEMNRGAVPFCIMASHCLWHWIPPAPRHSTQSFDLQPTSTSQCHIYAWHDLGSKMACFDVILVNGIYGKCDCALRERGAETIRRYEFEEAIIFGEPRWIMDGNYYTRKRATFVPSTTILIKRNVLPHKKWLSIFNR